MTVILLGTAHRVQGAERGICNIEDADYKTLVDQLWREHSLDFVFEEASGSTKEKENQARSRSEMRQRRMGIQDYP